MITGDGAPGGDNFHAGDIPGPADWLNYALKSRPNPGLGQKDPIDPDHETHLEVRYKHPRTGFPGPCV